MKQSGLHIGFIAQGWSPDVGGIESHTEDLTRCLVARGHRVSALVLDYSGKAEPFETTESQVADSHVTRMSYGYHDHNHLARMVRNRNAEAVVAKWIKSRALDLVHVHHLTGFGMGVLPLLHSHRVASVMTLHDYWPLCPRGQMMRFTESVLDGEVCGGLNPDVCGACIAKSFAHLMPSRGAPLIGPWDAELPVDLEQELPLLECGEGQNPDSIAAAHRTAYAVECLKHASSLVTPSERTRQIYRDVCAPLGLDGELIRVVENGVDVGGLAAEVAALRKADRSGPLVLGIVGSVMPSKGVLECAMAFADGQAKGRFGGQLKLEIHGNLPSYHGQTGYVDALQGLAARTEGLEVKGPFAHGGLAGVLAGLDGVAAPSRWEEVFGLTVREARAAGLVVLASNVGDLPAVTCGGRAGLVVEPPHGEHGRSLWTDAMQRFVEDGQARAEWAAYPAAPHSAEAMALEFESLFQELVKGS